MLKFKVGDRVRVRTDLQVGRLYGTACLFADPMQDFVGKEMLIKAIGTECVNMPYYILEDGTDSQWAWVDEMLEAVPTQRTYEDLIEFFKGSEREIFFQTATGQQVSLSDWKLFLQACGALHKPMENCELHIIIK